jgi:hypothetical protein
MKEQNYTRQAEQQDDQCKGQPNFGAKRRLFHSRSFRLLITLILFVLAAVTIWVGRADSICRRCASHQREYQIRFGSFCGWSIPLSPRWSKVRHSSVYGDFFGPDHQHTWGFADGSASYVFGMFCAAHADGLPNTNMAALEYNLYPNFRNTVQHAMQSGEISKNDFVGLLLMDNKELYSIKQQGATSQPAIVSWYWRIVDESNHFKNAEVRIQRP